MAKKTLLSKFSQPVHPVLAVILIGLVTIGIVTFFCTNFPVGGIPALLPDNQQLASRTITFAQPTPTRSPSLHTTYTSSKLGISFSYKPVIPNGIGQYFFIKEIGNTIYLYWVTGVNQPFTGTDVEFMQKIAPDSKYVKVVNKDPQLSLADTIRQQFLTGYSETDCIVKIPSYPPEPLEDPSYQTAQISIPTLINTTRKWDDPMAKCPAEYTNGGRGVSYFMMDPKHPDKLVFVTIGQDNIPSGVGGLTWDGTIKVLE